MTPEGPIPPVRILYLEDNPRDVEPLRDKLAQTGLAFELAVAKDREEFELALAGRPFDLIFSDYLLPSYDGMSAMSRARELQPDVPFILLSGVLGEEQAVDCVLRGATDYVLKHHLDRLVPATLRALREAEERRLRKKAEVERTRLQEQLQQASKMESLGLLAGGVAHDMNNVLGAILALASANLELHAEGSPAHRAFQTICKAAVRGGEMVRTLLDFARQNPAEEQNLDMNLILREEIQLLERTTLSRIHLELDLAPDLKLIRGDACALAHTVLNLCVNAVDAMGENGTLRLSTRNLDEEWVQVQVRDTGSGMSEDILKMALDPFFTTKPQGKGTGLGLSMVYSIVTAHRGKLDIQSRLGHGTCVTMCFPTKGASSAVPAPEVESKQASPGRSLLVLAVDDDELFLESVQDLLKVLGHSATPVRSGEEALDILRAGFQPDVMVLDLNMPGLSGQETLQGIRAVLPTVPVILITGRADLMALNLQKAYPHVTLLSKPFSMTEFKRYLEPMGRP